MTLRHPAALLTLLALTACATPGLEPAQDQALHRVCATDSVRIDSDFEGGAMHACRVTGPREFDIIIEPEDTPINPSAWYALRLTPQSAGPVRINLHYPQGRHRYRPKLSLDGDHWIYVEDPQIQVTNDRSTASILVTLDEAPLFLAGQEILTRSDYDAWMAPYRERDDLDISVIGQSLEAREIDMIAHTPDAPQGSLVLVGRQHPPETTGAVAMQAFVDEILGPSELATTFRDRFALAIIPLLNPDGVHHGHWRHNLGSTDLNRDWGPFAQPETQAALRVIDGLDADPATRPVLFLDFHSTNRDVFYTQPAGEDGTPYRFTALWLEQAGARLPGYEIERAERHQSDLPTAKNYMFGRFGIPSITYELGDNTDREQIRHTATVFAQEMMQVLLDHHPALAEAATD